MITIMNKKGQDVKFWFDYANGKYSYWKKIEGISHVISKRQYNNLLKKKEDADKNNYGVEI